MKILGISCYYHDSAATLLINGEIIAAAQEERFTRIKHDSSFPKNAINFCLQEGKIKFSDIDKIVFYEDPDIKYKRILKTYSTFFPKTIGFIFKTFPIWFLKKRFWKTILIKEFKNNFNQNINKQSMSIEEAYKILNLDPKKKIFKR